MKPRKTMLGRLCVALVPLLVAACLLVGEQAAQAANPPADIVFIIDESGSMGDDIAAVKANVGSIATQLEAHVDPRYGLVGFGALSGHWGVGNGVPHTHTDLTDTASFSAALNGLIASGGYEPGVQATTYAMNNLTGWRQGAGVCVVLVTDEDSDGGDLATARAALDARNATWFGIVWPGYGNTSSTYGPNAGSLSAHTGGDVFSIFDFRSNPQPVLDALIQKCITSIVQGITLVPTHDTNDAGTDHTVIATVKDNLLNPVVGVQVTFNVTSGPNSGKSGAATTDGAGEATFTHTGDGGIGTDTIQACFIDQDNNQVCAQATKEWIPSPIQPPVADPNGPYTGTEGSPVTFDGTGSSDPDGDPLTYEWDFGDGSPLGSGPTPSHTYADNDSYEVCLTVTDDDAATDTQCTTAEIDNVAPEVTVTPAFSQTHQYSDYICDVTFTATDVAADDMTAATTPDPLPDSLVLTDNGCTVSGGIRTCTWTLAGTMDEPVGDYDITVTVTDDDGGSDSAHANIIVVHEDADIWLDSDNTVAVEVDAPGGDSPSFILTAYVQEMTPDDATDCADPGDIGNAGVKMTLQAVGPGGSHTKMCTPVGVTGGGYGAVLEVQCDFDDIEVNTYHVQATVVGDYYTGGPDEDVLVVFDPSLGFTTGGGWFYWPGTEEKTNFGYTMKYNKKGAKVKGSLLLIRHVAPGEKYRVKSNALYGLSIGEGGDPVFGWASFSGKCTYKDKDWEEAQGNHEFLVYVEDHGEPGRGVDQFWIEVYDKDDIVISAMSMDRNAPDNTETLGGGNIVVPHTRASDGSK